MNWNRKYRGEAAAIAPEGYLGQWRPLVWLSGWRHTSSRRNTSVGWRADKTGTLGTPRFPGEHVTGHLRVGSVVVLPNWGRCPMVWALYWSNWWLLGPSARLLEYQEDGNYRLKDIIFYWLIQEKPDINYGIIIYWLIQRDRKQGNGDSNNCTPGRLPDGEDCLTGKTAWRGLAGIVTPRNKISTCLAL